MTISLHCILGGLDVSRETESRLDSYANALARWTEKINLISRSTLPDVWSRHFLDSAQLWPLANHKRGLWLDLGSGAGFPGLVIAILAHDLSPNLRIRLVESDSRKATFLQHVIQTTSITAEVVVQRIEALSPQGATILSARALAPLPILLEMTEKHRAPTGICLFPKGAAVHKEIADAERRWRFDYRLHPSRTHSEAAIVEIGAVTRA